MLSNWQNAHVISVFMEAMNKETPMWFNNSLSRIFIHVDLAETSGVEAFLAAHAELADVRVLYCYFHVRQAWLRYARSSLADANLRKDNHALAAKLSPVLGRLYWSHTEAEEDTRYKEFVQFCDNHSLPKYRKYFDETYWPEAMRHRWLRRRWTTGRFRPAHALYAAKTNNMVESFFNTLKLIVQRLTCRRIDDLILLLVYKVGRHFRAQAETASNFLNNTRLTQAVRRNLTLSKKQRVLAPDTDCSVCSALDSDVAFDPANLPDEKVVVQCRITPDAEPAAAVQVGPLPPLATPPTSAPAVEPAVVTLSPGKAVCPCSRTSRVLCEHIFAALRHFEEVHGFHQQLFFHLRATSLRADRINIPDQSMGLSAAAAGDVDIENGGGGDDFDFEAAGRGGDLSSDVQKLLVNAATQQALLLADFVHTVPSATSRRKIRDHLLQLIKDDAASDKMSANSGGAHPSQGRRCVSEWLTCRTSDVAAARRRP